MAKNKKPAYRGSEKKNLIPAAVLLATVLFSFKPAYSVEDGGLLPEGPAKAEATIDSAKNFFKSGRFDEAMEETYKILISEPENKTALLLKANIFRKKRDFKKAIPIYRKILEKGEDFDTRLGLSYAYLAAGNRTALLASKDLLKPDDPSREEELEELNQQIAAAMGSEFDPGFSYYSDSDENRVKRYALSYGAWIGNWKTDFWYKHIAARDNFTDAKAEEFFLKFYSKTTESVGAGAGFGVTSLGDHEKSDIVTGSLTTDISFPKGKAGLFISRSALSETAQLIENRIIVTGAKLSATGAFMDNLYVSVNYQYKDYSDNNSSNDLQISARYAWKRDPQIDAGYRIQYLSFARRSGQGYFDPRDFVSHQVFWAFYMERGKYYLDAGPFIGYQSFRRNGREHNDFISGGYGTFGVKLSKKVWSEVNVEGGNFALETATGFSYYLTGLRLRLTL